MKLFAILLIVLIVVAGIIGPQAFYVVDETQAAVVTRLGEVRRTISSPGLYAKIPFVESVTYFDKRRTLFDAPPEGLLTEDKKRLVIDAYAIGRITDAEAFFKKVKTAPQAVIRATDIVRSELRREIASDEQSEIIKTSREAIMNLVRDTVRPAIAEFGVETVDVRIMRADFPTEVEESIFNRMRAERKRIGDRERAEGEEQALELRASADREALVIVSSAERDANIIRGEAEGGAIAIFAEALEQDPEFYKFQRSLEAYKKFLTRNTTVVLPADSDLFEFLQSPLGNGKEE